MLHFIISSELDDWVIESDPLIQIDFEEKQFTPKLEIPGMHVANPTPPASTLFEAT